MSDFSCYVTLYNKTSFELTRDALRKPHHGSWAIEPPTNIKPKSWASWQLVDNFGAGTDGSVGYDLLVDQQHRRYRGNAAYEGGFGLSFSCTLNPPDNYNNASINCTIPKIIKWSFYTKSGKPLIGLEGGQRGWSPSVSLWGREAQIQKNGHPFSVLFVIDDRH